MADLSGISIFDAAVFFLVGLVVASIIIFVVTWLLEERKGYPKALLTALVGEIIYAIAYFLLGHGILAAVIGGVIWLFALKQLYHMSWLRSLAVAILVWIFAVIVGFFLPTGVGPL